MTKGARDVQQSIKFATSVKFSPSLYRNIKNKWKGISKSANVDQSIDLRLEKIKQLPSTVTAVNTTPAVSNMLDKMAKTHKLSKQSENGAKAKEETPPRSVEDVKESIIAKRSKSISSDEEIPSDIEYEDMCEIRGRNTMRRLRREVEIGVPRAPVEDSEILVEPPKTEAYSPKALDISLGKEKIAELSSVMNGRKILSAYVYTCYFSPRPIEETLKYLHLHFTVLGENLPFQTLQNNCEIIKLAMDDLTDGFDIGYKNMIILGPYADECEYLDVVVMPWISTKKRVLSKSLDSLERKVNHLSLAQTIRKTSSEEYVDKVRFETANARVLVQDLGITVDTGAERKRIAEKYAHK